MIQSPRGPIDIVPRNRFSREIPDYRYRNTPDTPHRHNLHNHSFTPENQLISNSTHKHTLTRQIRRQLAYSNTLLHRAQSAKNPLGVNPFWEAGAKPPIEWKQWFSILKMAIKASDIIEVNKFLKLKPQTADLFYPALPTYEDEFEGETEDEARNREQKNERRRVDFENEFEAIERKGALVDRIPWDEADTESKSLIYLSLGAEARQMYHQKNPHTPMEKRTAH